MGKNRVNDINGPKKVEELDPNELIIPGHLNEEKLKNTTKPDKIVVVFEDQNDGQKYVLDGRHATERARRAGTTVNGVILSEEDRCGRQNVLDRAIGLIIGKDKER